MSICKFPFRVGFGWGWLMRWGSGLVSQDEKEQWVEILPLRWEWGEEGLEKWGSVWICSQRCRNCTSHLVGILITLLSEFLGTLWILVYSRGWSQVNAVSCLEFTCNRIWFSRILNHRCGWNLASKKSFIPSSGLFPCRVGVIVGINYLDSVLVWLLEKASGGWGGGLEHWEMKYPSSHQASVLSMCQSSGKNVSVGPAVLCVGQENIAYRVYIVF